MSGTISEGGERLRVFLDGTHVETRWIADYYVIWQTGQRNGPPEGDPAHHTHYSAYVGAVALYLDIYTSFGRRTIRNCAWRTRRSIGSAESGPRAAPRPRSQAGPLWGQAATTLSSTLR
jgi:hypothetical protein